MIRYDSDQPPTLHDESSRTLRARTRTDGDATLVLWYSQLDICGAIYGTFSSPTMKNMNKSRNIFPEPCSRPQSTANPAYHTAIPLLSPLQRAFCAQLFRIFFKFIFIFHFAPVFVIIIIALLLKRAVICCNGSW